MKSEILGRLYSFLCRVLTKRDAHGIHQYFFGEALKQYSEFAPSLDRLLRFVADLGAEEPYPPLPAVLRGLFYEQVFHCAIPMKWVKPEDVVLKKGCSGIMRRWLGCSVPQGVFFDELRAPIQASLIWDLFRLMGEYCARPEFNSEHVHALVTDGDPDFVDLRRVYLGFHQERLFRPLLALTPPGSRLRNSEFYEKLYVLYEDFYLQLTNQP